MTGPSAPARPLTILAIYAHPDDGEFHAAGSLAKWAAAGHRICAICATDGAAGAKRRDLSSAVVAAARQEELARAMAAVGGEPPIMLGYPDAFLRDHAAALRERLIYWIRKLRPDRVITFDPWKRYEIHPDHIEAGRMASEASVFACFPLIHPEHLDAGMAPWQPAEVWYMGPLEHKPNRIVDISATVETKIAAILCHDSQVEMLAGWFVPGADPTQLSDAQRAALAGGTRQFVQGMAAGLASLTPPVKLAEAFYALPTGPGHFENYESMAREMMGAPPEEPVVC